MRKDFGAKAMLYPMPVLMVSTYDENGNPDIMNAAWGGIADDTKINICLSPEHKTVKNIQAGSDFTVSMPPQRPWRPVTMSELSQETMSRKK